MRKRITIPYTSAWFTVVLPTVEFLLIWIGLPILLYNLVDWNFPDWVAFLVCGTSLVIALVACVLTYPFILHLAERGRGELVLEGDRLRWRTGRRWHEIDLAQPHEAMIAAGYSGLEEPNASITFHPGSEIIHLRGAPPRGGPPLLPRTVLRGRTGRGAQRGPVGF